MQESFYKDILHFHGIDVLIPNEEEIQTINQIIFSELCVGKIETLSLNFFVTLIQNYQKEHTDLDAVIGCTEIGLLLHQKTRRYRFLIRTTIQCKATALCI